MRRVVFLLLAFFILRDSPALAADIWSIPADTQLSTFKNVKAAAVLYYTDPSAGSNIKVKYIPTSLGFSLDRSAGDITTGLTLKGDTFQISASMNGGGFKAGKNTAVAAYSVDPQELTLSDTTNSLSWTSDASAIMAAVTEGSFTENLDRTGQPDGTINFKLTYTIEGTLSNGNPGKIVVTINGSRLMGH